MTNPPTPRPRRRSRTTAGPRITVPRRAVIETVPEPRSEGDPRHLALAARSTRRADR